MENLKSLQEGGPEVIDETKQIAEALTKMVNEQKVPLEQALMQMFQSGVQQNQAVEVLMSMGYTEADIQSIFQSIQEKTQPKEEEPELIEEEPEEQQVQENQDLVQQEQPIAKKGKEKYNKGGGFRSWMNRNLGYISDNDRYDVPIQYSHLPTSKRDAGLDFVTNMFRLGKRAANVVKDAKARKNDSSYNKSLIKFGKDANPEDFYITDESIYQASQNNGNLITKDQAVQMMKDKSRFMYNPDTKAYSFALATNPYASQSEIQDQIDREMGSNYRDKYKEASLPQLENLLKFTRSFLPINQLGGGTHNTYYGQVGMEYPGTINQTEFPGFTFGDTSDYKASEDNRPLSFRNWFAQNYGSNLNFANQSQADLKQQYSSYLQDFDPYTYVSEDVKEKPKDKPGSILDPLRDIETNYTDEEVDAYMNLSEDLAASNFVNKGSMGKQPSVEAQQQLQDAMPKDTSATVNIKNKGAFSKALDTAADVSGLAVDVGRTLVDLKENAENIKKKNENTYRYAGDKFGTDIGKKGYWTPLDGILSPDHQTERMAQIGAELYKAQIGIPPLFDDTKKKKPVVYTLDEEKYKANQDSTKMHNLTLKQMEAFPMVGSFRNPQHDYSEKSYIKRLGKGDRGVYFDLEHLKKSGKPTKADLDFIKEIQSTGVTPAYYTGVDPLSNTIKPTKEWEGLDPITGGVYDEDYVSWNPYYPEPEVEMKFGQQPQDKKITKIRKTPDSNRSVVDRMVEMGVDPSFENRKGWYEANFPNEDYKGTPDQNLALNKYFSKYLSKIRAKSGIELPKYQIKGELFPYSGPEEKAGYGNYWQTIYNNAQKLHKQKMLGDPSYRLEQGNIDNKKYLIEPELYGDPQSGEFIAMYQDGKRVPREQVITDPNKLREFIGLRKTDRIPWLNKYYSDIKSQKAEYIKQPGGQINPFGKKKRQLRKRTGGQVANISTEVLRKLQATKGPKFKFDIL